MISKPFFLLFVAFIATTVAPNAFSDDECSPEAFRMQINTENNETSARAMLECINSSVRYNEIYNILQIALNENTHYPIPNELVDKVLQQFQNPDEYDMDSLADSITDFSNSKYELAQGILTYLSHPKIEPTGLYKVVQSAASNNNFDPTTRKQLIIAIKATNLYSSENLLSDSFRQNIFQNITSLAINSNGVIEPGMEDIFFEHIQQADDDALKGIVTGIHKSTLTISDTQQFMINIVSYDTCKKGCQSSVIQLVTYNDVLKLTDRDVILTAIAQKPDTSDYILGNLTVAAWDARVPLEDPEVLLKTIGAAENFDTQANLKMKQAVRQLGLKLIGDEVH